MSIYGRRKGLMDYESVHQAPAPQNALSGTRSPSRGLDSAQDWSQVRRAKPVETLLPMSERWLSSLPPDIRPLALTAQFPRIVNLIALQWNDRRRCPQYFEELSVDRRGGRQGFPAGVKVELSALLDYWYSRDPTVARD
jgi:hypothetical protein